MKALRNNQGSNSIRNNALRPDKVNSTYWWEMAMLPGQHVKTLIGYSKFEGENNSESVDKDHCLMSKIEMFYKNGYFAKTTHIDIYQRKGLLCNKMNDVLLVTLYPDHFDIPAERVYSFRPAVRQFLTSFYKLITKGEAPVRHLRPQPEIKSKDDLLLHPKKPLNTTEQVLDYCDFLRTHGTAPGSVNAFAEKHMERLFLEKQKRNK